jgi:hypothetical protein
LLPVQVLADFAAERASVVAAATSQVNAAGSEVEALRRLLRLKGRELQQLRQLGQEVLLQRSEVEIFLLSSLHQVGVCEALFVQCCCVRYTRVRCWKLSQLKMQRCHLCGVWGVCRRFVCPLRRRGPQEQQQAQASTQQQMRVLLLQAQGMTSPAHLSQAAASKHTAVVSLLLWARQALSQHQQQQQQQPWQQ